MSTQQTWASPEPDGKNFLAALVLGLLLELGTFFVLLPLFTPQPPPAQVQAPVKLTIVAPPAPKPPPPPKPIPPKPVIPPTPIIPPKPLPPPPPRPVAQHIIHHAVPPRPTPPPPPPQPVQPPPPPPTPPAPAAPSLGQVDLFRLAMKAAVQAVANQVYPQGAQAANEAGTPTVSFTYVDGMVSNVTLLHSCGYPMLDAAAEQAVRIAHYPAEPSNFHGQSVPVTVSVIFALGAPDVGSD